MGAISATALLCLASCLYAPIASAQAPYPPSNPCALSWNEASADSATMLVGSGLGSRQPVDVTLYPQSESLGSFTTDSTGAFEAPVAVPDDAAASWLTARSPQRSCSTHLPPPKTAPAPSGGGGAGGTGGYPPGSSSSRGTGSSTAPTSASLAPSNSPGAGSNSPAPHSSPPPVSGKNTLTPLGLPVAVIITIAILLLLAGGLAVLVLTRRAG